MKAKELKDDKYFQHSVDGEVLSEGYLFTKEEMAIFWSQLCKEQRELCLHSFEEVGHYPNADESILTAPEPEIE